VDQVSNLSKRSSRVDNEREPEQTEVPSMLLRDHPLKSRHGVPNWPPVGTSIGELENTRPEGETGVLKSAIPSRIQPADRFFLCIDYEDSSYTGGLLLADYALCQQAAEQLFNFAAIIP
jgi:hypothetical protein